MYIIHIIYYTGGPVDPVHQWTHWTPVDHCTRIRGDPKDRRAGGKNKYSYIIHMDNISDIMSLKIENNPKITVALKADETSVMSNVQTAHSELREAQALKINYHTKTKKKSSF